MPLDNWISFGKGGILIQKYHDKGEDCQSFIDDMHYVSTVHYPETNL